MSSQQPAPLEFVPSIVNQRFNATYDRFFGRPRGFAALPATLRETFGPLHAAIVQVGTTFTEPGPAAHLTEEAGSRHRALLALSPAEDGKAAALPEGGVAEAGGRERRATSAPETVASQGPVAKDSQELRGEVRQEGPGPGLPPPLLQGDGAGPRFVPGELSNDLEGDSRQASGSSRPNGEVLAKVGRSRAREDSEPASPVWGLRERRPADGGKAQHESAGSQGRSRTEQPKLLQHFCHDLEIGSTQMFVRWRHSCSVPGGSCIQAPKYPRQRKKSKGASRWWKALKQSFAEGGRGAGHQAEGREHIYDPALRDGEQEGEMEEGYPGGGLSSQDCRWPQRQHGNTEKLAVTKLKSGSAGNGWEQARLENPIGSVSQEAPDLPGAEMWGSTRAAPDREGAVSLYSAGALGGRWGTSANGRGKEGETAGVVADRVEVGNSRQVVAGPSSAEWLCTSGPGGAESGPAAAGEGGQGSPWEGRSAARQPGGDGCLHRSKWGDDSEQPSRPGPGSEDKQCGQGGGLSSWQKRKREGEQWQQGHKRVKSLGREEEGHGEGRGLRTSIPLMSGEGGREQVEGAGTEEHVGWRGEGTGGQDEDAAHVRQASGMPPATPGLAGEGTDTWHNGELGQTGAASSHAGASGVGSCQTTPLGQKPTCSRKRKRKQSVQRIWTLLGRAIGGEIVRGLLAGGLDVNNEEVKWRGLARKVAHTMKGKGRQRVTRLGRALAQSLLSEAWRESVSHGLMSQHWETTARKCPRPAQQFCSAEQHGQEGQNGHPAWASRSGLQRPSLLSGKATMLKRRQLGMCPSGIGWDWAHGGQASKGKTGEGGESHRSIEQDAAASDQIFNPKCSLEEGRSGAGSGNAAACSTDYVAAGMEKALRAAEDMNSKNGGVAIGCRPGWDQHPKTFSISSPSLVSDVVTVAVGRAPGTHCLPASGSAPNKEMVHMDSREEVWEEDIWEEDIFPSKKLPGVLSQTCVKSCPSGEREVRDNARLRSGRPWTGVFPGV